jgi:hypothetical protein
MANIDEDDGFIDNDLDAFTADDFLELQQQAIRATQRPDYSLPSSANVTLRPKGLPVDGDAAGQTPPHPSSDYGDLDEEVLNAAGLDDPQTFLAGRQVGEVAPVNVGEAVLREQWRHQRYSGLPQLQKQHPGFQARSGPGFVHVNHANNNHHIDQDDGGASEDEMLDDPTKQVFNPQYRAYVEPSKPLEANVAEVSFTIEAPCLPPKAHIVIS